MMPPEVVEVRSHEAGASLAITGDTTNQPDAHDLQDCYWLATLTCGQLHASLRFYELSALHHWTASAELLLDAAGLERLARDAQALR